jgi:hypothetical protein
MRSPVDPRYVAKDARSADIVMGVRRDFVKWVLARKTAPKRAGVFMAECLVREVAC